jgi:signal transduction histidine kinase
MELNSPERMPKAFQTIIDHFPGGITLFNRDLEMVASNKVLREMLDFPDELFANGLPSLKTLLLFNARRGEYGPGDPETLAEQSFERARGMKPHVFERTRPNGSVLEVRGEPLPEGGFVSIYVDISDRKRAEAEALRTASYFQEVLANLPFGVLVLDTELNTVFWNTTVETLFGLPTGSIAKGKSVKDSLRILAEKGFYGPGDPEEQTNRRFDSFSKFQANSVELTRPDGGILLVRTSPVLIGDAPAGLILLQEDITERKQDEQRARERDMEKSLSVLRHAVGNISQGISMMADDLSLVVCNPRFLELLEFPDSLGVPGTPFEAYMRYNAERGEYGPGDVEEQVRVRVEMARQFKPHVFERERPDGTIIEVVGKPLPDGGFITTYTDITERKRNEIALREFNATLERKVADRTEALQQALAELGTVIHNLEETQEELVRSEKLAGLGAMVAGIAHELNTPIGNSLMVASHLTTAGKKMSDALKSGLKRSVLDEFLEATESSSDLLVRNLTKAAELVSSFKQVAVDQTSSQRRSFNLAEMVAEVVTTLGPTIRKTPFVVELNIPDDIVMESFPGPLGQVMTNLINNGIIHGFDGRTAGRILIEAEKGANNETVVLKVSDNGNGIPAAILPRVFDPFFTTKLGHGGSGLGLNIVHNMVFSILGGRISVESVVGQGTCFTMTLATVSPEQDTASLPPPPVERRSIERRIQDMSDKLLDGDGI